MLEDKGWVLLFVAESTFSFAHIKFVCYTVLVMHVNAIQPSDHLIMNLFFSIYSQVQQLSNL